jgi:glycerophosphoryl diester phosphodiesterase
MARLTNFQANRFKADGIFNIAHRGARAFAPENTLAAFEKAKNFGCQMFEIDVHQALDGELIVHHDDLLTRCTDVKCKFPNRNSYYISDFSYQELMQLDAGSWFVEQLVLPVGQRQLFLQTLTDQEIEGFISANDLEFYQSGRVKLPTLKQTLAFALEKSLLVNIEIKSLPRMYPGIADAVVDLVENMAMQSNVLISSFDHLQLQLVRQHSKKIATGVLTSDRMVDPAKYLDLLDADAFHPGRATLGFDSVALTLDTHIIQSVRDQGRAVHVWTLNTEVEMQKAIEAGVSGLISDFPNRVRDTLANDATAKF